MLALIQHTWICESYLCCYKTQIVKHSFTSFVPYIIHSFAWGMQPIDSWTLQNCRLLSLCSFKGSGISQHDEPKVRFCLTEEFTKRIMPSQCPREYSFACVDEDAIGSRSIVFGVLHLGAKYLWQTLISWHWSGYALQYGRKQNVSGIPKRNEVLLI
jgi:hypothetical protein